MAPVSLRKLISIQNTKIREIQLIGSRLRDKDCAALNKRIIRARIDSIKRIWGEIRETHVEILCQDEAAEDEYVTGNVFSQLQDNYQDTCDQCLSLSNELEGKEGDNHAGNPGTVPINDTSFLPVKLPKIDLPIFSGQYEEWEEFRNLFTLLIHDAPGVDATTKFLYLKSCLRGPAAVLVKDVRITEANYASTWQVLVERFHNPRLVVRNHLNALLNIPSLKRESAVQLRSFIDEAQKIVRALANLGMPVNSWDIWFVHILSSRLDNDLRKLWEFEWCGREQQIIIKARTDNVVVKLLDRFPKYGDFIDFLERRLQVLSVIEDERSSDRFSAPTTKFVPGSRRSFHTSTSRSFRHIQQRCESCSGSHSIFKCSRFLAKPSQNRRDEICQLRLCFNCLGSHKQRDCSLSGRCRTCQGKHHTLLHVSAPTRNVNELDNPTNGVANNNQVPVPMNTMVLTSNIDSTVAHREKECSVILATAYVMVSNDRGYFTRVRALLDQDSEVSFISESMAQLLGIIKTPTHTSLSGLESNKIGMAHSIVRFNLTSDDDSSFILHVKALVLSKLTSKLPSREIVEPKCDLFKNIRLADPRFFTPGTIDLILGAEVYRQLLKPGLRCSSFTGLAAQETIFGWVLSGSTDSEYPRQAESSLASQANVLHGVTDVDLSQALERF